MKKLAIAAALAVAGLSAGGAQATVTNWGTHDPVEFGTATPFVLAPGLFNDVFTFVLGTTSSISTSAVAINNGSILNIRGGVVGLWSDLGAVGVSEEDEFVSAFAYRGDTGNITHTISSLDAGSYYYVVRGNANGSFGGAYSLTSTVPIPEPGTWAMFATGGMLLGFALRRNRAQ
jgi:hypothetical protein